MDFWTAMDAIMIGFVLGGLAIGGLVFACVSKQHTLEIQRLERMIANEKQERQDACERLGDKIYVVRNSVHDAYGELGRINFYINQLKKK